MRRYIDGQVLYFASARPWERATIVLDNTDVDARVRSDPAGSWAARAAWPVRAERPDDITAVRAVTRAAFPTDAEADLVDALRADPAWIDGLSMVAQDGAGDVVAHALLTRCHVGQAPALCLAPVSVRPDVQGRGAGTAVVHGTVRAAREAGEAHVIVLGHPGYYPRFGFRPAEEAGIRLAIEVAPGALMALSLDPDRPLPSGVVRYAQPFAIPGE
jgi:predicted N-acetyltransferase YhbS